MSRLLLLSVATVFSFVCLVSAQDVDISGLGGGGISLQFSLGSEAADGISQAMVFTQVDPGLPTEPQALVRIPRVIDNLQLIDSQLVEIKERSQQTVKKYQRRRDDLDSRYDEKARQSPEFAQNTNKINEAQKKELMEIVDSVLLPFQRTRLQQISAQAKLNANGSGGLDEFARELDLTEEQKKKLAESAADFEKRLREEIKALRRKRQREHLNSVLTKEQEKKLDEMLGDELAEEKPMPSDEKK